MIPVRRGARVVAALAFAGAATLGVASQPAHAVTKPTHVAIVVAGAGAACVGWHSGMTGAEVLSSNFSVTYGQRAPYIGFVLKINGVGTDRPDDTHYWAYFHDTGGGWAYSGSGAASYYPQPGAIEGWSHDTGANPAPSPAGTSYAAVCAGQDAAPAPTRPPTHITTHPPSTRHTSSAPAVAPIQPPAPGRATPGTAAASPTSSRAASAASPADHHRSARPAHSSGATATPPSEARTPDPSAAQASTPAVHLVGASSQAKPTSAVPALGTGLALVAAGAIGGTALWRLRRHRRG